MQFTTQSSSEIGFILTNTADLTDAQKAICDDLLARLAAANEVIVAAGEDELKTRQKKLWDRVCSGIDIAALLPQPTLIGIYRGINPQYTS